MIDNKTIQDRKTAVSVTAEATPAVAGLLTAAGYLHPLIAAAVGLVAASWKIHEAIVPKRMDELTEFLESHKAEFVQSAVQREETASLIIQLIEQHIRENSERKRVMLRSAILQAAKGQIKETDWHTKLLSVLNQITISEAESLHSVYQEQLRQNPSEEDMIRYRSTPDIFAQFIDADDPRAEEKEATSRRLSEDLHSLHAYRLLNVNRPAIGLEVSFTPFGIFFVKHIFQPARDDKYKQPAEATRAGNKN